MPHALIGRVLPRVSFVCTDGTRVPIEQIPGRMILQVHPGAIPPGDTVPQGWYDIPGAVGCVGECLCFSDLAEDFRRKGIQLFGVSSRDLTTLERFQVSRTIRYHFLSDKDLLLRQILGLEVFDCEGRFYYRRVTLLILDGTIIDVVDNITDAAANPHAVLEQAIEIYDS